MCGRFTLRVTPKVLGDLFGISDVPLFEPRFNIVRTQPLVVNETDARNIRSLEIGKEPSRSCQAAAAPNQTPELNAEADRTSDFIAAQLRQFCVFTKSA